MFAGDFSELLNFPASQLPKHSSREQIGAEYGNGLAADQDTVILQADAKDAPSR